ncbi:hypothetical protein D6C86_00228 [Aureobasidium pullulans]|uniref:BTB domain-containing protein n=1 Tax=Aureobasidium pullulans TaxID=5580 RepID=A0A4S9Q8U1_AURPU|nr:hypothetical protein D6C94_01465 [Aureobasidium pullulans]THZ45897.1 hypothetical protein D6C87_02547 [Aureobasidium pullulans]THZ68155.1 hypothetical protein D6C86_00228 [Aureobasidium pullulans]
MASTATTPSGPVAFANSKIFNIEENSDIILTFNGQKIYAHRIILRMWSPFFERALTSKFAVAQSQTFSLGDDDSPEAIWAMFHLNGENALDYHIDVYEIADKYDCPSLRQKAVQGFSNCMGTFLADSEIGETVPIIRRICGSATSHPANSEIRVLMVKFLYYHSAELAGDIDFVEALARGDLLDAASAKDFLTIVLYANFCLRKAAHYSETKRKLTGSLADRSIRKMAIDLGGDENPFAY